jgi:hypothetical protein
MIITKNNNIIGGALSALIGIAVWLIFWKSAGKSDPQSTDSYWNIGYPIFMAASCILGYFFNKWPWQWGTIIILFQLIPGFFMLSGDLNLLPLGILLHIFFAIPLVLCGYLGRWIYHRKNGTNT